MPFGQFSPPPPALPSGSGMVTPPSLTDVLRWAGAFALVAVVFTSAAESDAWAEPAAALAWLLAIGATAYWWTDFDRGLALLLGHEPAPETGAAKLQ